MAFEQGWFFTGIYQLIMGNAIFSEFGKFNRNNMHNLDIKKKKIIFGNFYKLIGKNLAYFRLGMGLNMTPEKVLINPCFIMPHQL